jgi:hypothetical protein
MTTQRLKPYSALILFYIIALIAFVLWFGLLFESNPVYQGISTALLVGLFFLFYDKNHEIDFSFSTIATASRYFLAMLPLFFIFLSAVIYAFWLEQIPFAIFTLISSLFALYSLYYKISPLPFAHQEKQLSMHQQLKRQVTIQRRSLEELLEEEKNRFKKLHEQRRKEIAKTVEQTKEKEILALKFAAQAHELKLEKIKNSIIAQYEIDDAIAKKIEEQANEIMASSLTEDQKEALINEVIAMYKIERENRWIQINKK